MATHAMAHGRRITAALIDLDDTLYRSERIPALVKKHISGYMIEHLGYSKDNAEEEMLQLYKDHGTTLAGLVAKGHEIDYDHWHAFVHHELPYSELLHPDRRTREILNALDVPCHIFTNADRKHAEICLRHLGIEQCFQELVCFEAIQERGSATSAPVLCKPAPEAFDAALRLAGVASPSEAVFVDDSTRNIKSARAKGLLTVLVGHTEPHEDADIVVPNVHELPRALPELFGHAPSLLERVAALGSGGPQPLPEGIPALA